MFNLPLAKLYASFLMSSLNSRESLRSASDGTRRTESSVQLSAMGGAMKMDEESRGRPVSAHSCCLCPLALTLTARRAQISHMPIPPRPRRFSETIYVTNDKE